MQAAQNISQVFMGINLKCASCHDSFISNWKLQDAYALASLYAEEPLEIFRCDKPTGKVADRRFLYPQLGAIEETADRDRRLKSLADVITCEENGRLTRTLVNRLWAKFFGRGLIEPVDEMDNLPWSADLLDWLASDLAQHGYDLQRTIELILTSRAYQLPAVGGDEQIDQQYVFRGPIVRRLSAEQFLDALSTLTGVWHSLPANREIDFNAGQAEPDEPPPAFWLWTSESAEQAAAPGAIYLRKTFDLPETPAQALAVAAADNRFALFVNGQQVGAGSNWKQPGIIDIRKQLRPGRNVLAVEAKNDEVKSGEVSPNPAGFLCAVRVRLAEPDPARGRDARTTALDFGSDRSWLCSSEEVEGWQNLDFDPRGWQPATELGGSELAPWNLRRQLAVAWSVAAQHGRVRAALVASDPLMRAMGRPNREQVVTRRATVATTMEALELTNGATLAEFLRQGAERLMAENEPPLSELATRLYTQGLGRPPTSEEIRIAAMALGESAETRGLEDFLWALAMLPEFQLIY
jgi:hypothetical protein